MYFIYIAKKTFILVKDFIYDYLNLKRLIYKKKHIILIHWNIFANDRKVSWIQLILKEIILIFKGSLVINYLL